MDNHRIRNALQARTGERRRRRASAEQQIGLLEQLGDELQTLIADANEQDPITGDAVVEVRSSPNGRGAALKSPR